MSLSPPPTLPSTLPLLTCAVGLPRVGGEAYYLQVGELGGHVVFPGDHHWRRTQVGFVQHQDHLLLEVSCDVVVQGWRELQHLGSLNKDIKIVIMAYATSKPLDHIFIKRNKTSCAVFNVILILVNLHHINYIWHES